MNKVPGILILISRASRQIQQMSVHLIRAKSNFLVKESLDNALKELKETQKLLEAAKVNYGSS